MLQQVMSLSAHQEDILAMFQFASWFEELFQFAGGWLLNPREGPRGQTGSFPSPDRVVSASGGPF